MSPTNPVDIFKQEAQELLAQLETTLLDLDCNPDDPDLIDAAFRALHTIKGSGAMFGFDAAAAFTHHVETAFDLIRQGKASPHRGLIAVALRARDYMRLLIERPEEADPAASEALLAALHDSVHPAEEPAAAPAEFANERLWRIRMRLPRDAMANGTNPFLLLDELRSLGEAAIAPQTADVPPLAEIDPSACYIAWDIDLKTKEPRTAIEDVFMFVRDEMQLDIEPAGSALAEAQEEAESDEAAPPPGDLNKEVPIQPEPLAKADAVPDASARSPAAETQRSRREAAKSNSSIRVPAERLDELMDRVGELVITQSRLKQIAASSSDQHVKTVAEEIERLVLELRDTTMGIRMVPIGSLFGRFRRVVHDLSRDLGKQVDLIMEGEETELDKTVIEQLNDPLVHLIRNSIDHGIEEPAERIAAGKAPAGQITLAARHAGTEVHISIIDDGRGLNRERIRARAIERGLISADASPSDAELFQIVFQPGFSTAAQVTNMSGRGVGMDVVKRTIEALRGKIELSSMSDKGSMVTLRLPLTLAIIDGLLVRIGQARYVLPLSAVEECVELPPDDDARSRGCSFLNIRGELVPFLRLRQLFAAKVPPDRYQKVVVVAAGGLKAGLVVDQVIGNHQTVIKSLSKLHAGIEMFSGATILGDGAVALILDIPHLVTYGQIAEEHVRAAA